MALDKSVDSTQLDNALTSVAAAIRAKSGGSAALAFPAGFISEIGNIPSRGRGIALDWASSITEIKVGANSVTNMAGVQSYFSAYNYKMILLADPLTANNQFVFGLSNNSDGHMSSAARWRSGTISTTTVGVNYDASLVPGTSYYLIAE